MTDSFLFYDLETFGSDPRTSRIAQFAAIRTDTDLNPIEEPISFFVRPADDLLPSPGATMVTGISPQYALREGVSEAAAFALIFEEMSRPGTCTLGYNSLRFDDEFIRHGLFRNFFDAYEREWRGGNCRWDLLDVMRFAHALRPEGIVWPKREDGATSFKLELLAEANGVREGDAHEALSDVRALIGLARKLKSAQPKLWEYALRLRCKRFAGSLFDLATPAPVLHVSQRFPAHRLCAAPVFPLSRHPHIDSRVLVFDLAQDPQRLLDASVSEIHDRLYVAAADLPPGEERIALKEVHLNRCPALVAWNHLRASDLARLGIDAGQVLAHAERVRAAGPALAEKVRAVFAVQREREPGDPDGALYAGFVGEGDKRLMQDVRATQEDALKDRPFAFRDGRLSELLFRYRARNWPHTLDCDEKRRWDDYRRRRLHEEHGLSEYSFARYRAEVAQLRALHTANGARQVLLDQLDAWANDLEASLH